MDVASRLLGHPIWFHLRALLLRKRAKRVAVLAPSALQSFNRRVKLWIIERDTKPTAWLYNGMESIPNLDSQMVRDCLGHSEAHGIANLTNRQRAHCRASLQIRKLV